jgi:two-component system sensor histidine kinase ChvG
VRILFVNLLALAIPVGGGLYLAQYQDQLIANELAAMTTEAKLFSVAIAEGCVTHDLDDNPFIMPQLARQMIRHLVGNTTIWSQLIDANGVLLVDSHQLIGPGGIVQLEELPPPHPVHNAAESWLERIGDWLSTIPGREHIPHIGVKGLQRSQILQTMQPALDGNLSTQVWINREGSLILIVAAPVQNLETVLGAVTIVHDGQKIDSALRSLRLELLKVFGLALAITTFLSFYLAGKISRPIRKLASAAIAQTQDVGQGRRIEIPDFAGRRDEIGDLSVALRQMTEALWQRMDAIERFAADVAHELKNPLTSLRSAVETAERISDPAQKARLMDIVADDVGRMDRLISDISNASRLDAELSRVEPEPIDVCEMLRIAVDISSTSEIVVEIAEGGEDTIIVPGLEGRLMQVFQNLIENAISFSPSNGKVTIRIILHESEVEIQIEDQGVGIPDNKLTQIFDRFYTERPPAEAFGKHSGLGLSIARQIIEAHRGRIYAENRVAVDGTRLGARFIVILPRARKRSA